MSYKEFDRKIDRKISKLNNLRDFKKNISLLKITTDLKENELFEIDSELFYTIELKIEDLLDEKIAELEEEIEEYLGDYQ